MGTKEQQLLGFFLGLLGLIGTLASTVLPQWRQTAYFSANFLTASYYMKGLWMECVSHTAGIYQCEVHRSMLSLPKDVLAARALMLLSCAISVVAAIISAVGMECTRCAQHSHVKSSLAVSGGACSILAGLFCLITASWMTTEVIRNAYDVFSTSGMKYDIGLAVYLSFASAFFSIFGGGALCVATWNARKKIIDKMPGSREPHRLIPDHKANPALEGDQSSLTTSFGSGFRHSISSLEN
ncbi:claudin-14-like [Trichomycterus rosablanca]|uniref:claudin-14-like n=1 Tax=Trichomycterus rosablanca TaxID=2290929 RepID=UPI002F35391B